VQKDIFNIKHRYVRIVPVARICSKANYLFFLYLFVEPVLYLRVSICYAGFGGGTTGGFGTSFGAQVAGTGHVKFNPVTGKYFTVKKIFPITLKRPDPGSASQCILLRYFFNFSCIFFRSYSYVPIEIQ
jgi:hypothetical protein